MSVGVGLLDAEADVPPALLDRAARGPGATSPGCRERPAHGLVLTPKSMAIVGSSTRMGGSGRGALAVGDRVADVDVLDAGDRDDVAGGGALDLDALQPLPAVERASACRAPACRRRGRACTGRRRRARRRRRGRSRAGRRSRRSRGCWPGTGSARRARGAGPGSALDDGLEERPQVGARLGEVAGRGAGARVGVDDREVELLPRSRRGR